MLICLKIIKIDIYLRRAGYTSNIWVGLSISQRASLHVHLKLSSRIDSLGGYIVQSCIQGQWGETGSIDN